MTMRAFGRRGFTLIELLVVLFIIALLMALSFGALFRLRQNAAETNTNTAISKIDMLFRQQWRSALARANSETLPQPVIDITRGPGGVTDIAKARALHVKLRMRQEFPQSFFEVEWNPSPPALVPGKFNYYYPAVPTIYQPKATYVTATAGLSDQPELEAAALLYIICTQSRGGGGLSPEDSAKTQQIQIGGKNMTVFVDEWGNPITFRRTLDFQDQLDNNEVLLELNQTPFVASNGADPQDPDRRLIDPAKWQSVAAYQTALSLFVSPNAGAPRPGDRPIRPAWLAPSINSGPPATIINMGAHPFDGLNRGPFIFSIGKDWKSTLVPTAFTPTGEFRMSQDDLLSYRIRMTGRGN